MSDFSAEDKEELKQRLKSVRRRVARACERAGREPDEVCLIAVSKTHPVEALAVLYEEGVRDFGESYVQEWLEKKQGLPEDIRWHFIGRLQSNKARFVVEEGVALVHSLDRRSLAKSLARRSDEPVDVLIQVDISGEETKGGVPEGELLTFFDYLQTLPDIRVRGLMTMPPYADDGEESRPYFKRLNVLLEDVRRHCATHQLSRDSLKILSMGMTHDFEVAIEEGATDVRVGTALFGERKSQ